MFKKIFCFILPIFLLCSCIFDKGNIRYGVTTPYVTVEKKEYGELIDVKPIEIKNKINNKESFVLFLHNTSCSHCQRAIKDFIEPFLEKHPIIIYGLNREECADDEIDLYEEITLPLGNFYQGSKVVPYFAIYDKGEFQNGELESKYYELLFETYLIL